MMWNTVFLSDRNPSSGLNNTNSLPVVYDVRGLPVHTSQYYTNQHQNQNQNRSFTTIYQSTLTQCVWIFFWLVFLILISFPLSLIATFIYVLLCPIAGVWTSFSNVTNFLVQISQLPTYASKNLIDSKALLPM